MFDNSPHKREIDGLRSRRDVRRYLERQAARKASAEARKADAEARQVEARVRHLNFELIARVVLLALTMAGWLVAILGTPDDPTLAKLAYGAAAGWTAIAGLLIHTLRPKSEKAG